MLEFDHLDPTTKLTEVVKLVEQQAAWERVEAEIAKCDVCCANCHRVRTAERADQRRHRYERARRQADAVASAERLHRLLPCA